MKSRRIACFISPHGLGHAARVSAVLAAFQELDPDLELELFSTAPRTFFETSGCRNLTLHHFRGDLGFAQKSALVEDIPETIRILDTFLPFDPALVASLAETVQRSRCRAVICDIAPLGIAVARAAGLPSVLIENFRWDDLYSHYERTHPRMAHHAATLRPWFDAADLTIQTEPVCRRSPTATLLAGPTSRPPRTGRATIRRQLGLPETCRMVLITMGGVSERTPLLAHLAGRTDLCFVVAWGADRTHRAGNVICLPLQSEYYHPDLIHAADAVIGKVGYSTLAEVYHAGTPYGYIPRRGYPEMPALVTFIEAHMAGLPLADANLGDGVDPGFIDRLLALPRSTPSLPNGARPIAELLHRTIQRD